MPPGLLSRQFPWNMYADGYQLDVCCRRNCHFKLRYLDIYKPDEDSSISIGYLNLEVLSISGGSPGLSLTFSLATYDAWPFSSSSSIVHANPPASGTVLCLSISYQASPSDAGSFAFVCTLSLCAFAFEISTAVSARFVCLRHHNRYAPTANATTARVALTDHPATAPVDKLYDGDAVRLALVVAEDVVVGVAFRLLDSSLVRVAMILL